MTTNTNGKNLIPAPTVNALEAYATSETPFYGDLLKFSGKDGCWSYGQQGLTLDKGTVLVAIVPEMYAGFVKWGDGGLVDQRLVPIAVFDKKALRATLDQQDREEWEQDEETGRRKDPWTECAWLPLINAKTKAKFTYSTSSYGGRKAVKNLVGAYAEHVKGAQRANKPPDLPVVVVDGDKHPAAVKSHGMIHDPILDLIDWIRTADVFGATEPELSFEAFEDEAPPHVEIPPEPEQDVAPTVPAATQAKARKRARV